MVSAHCKSCEEVLSSFLTAYNHQNDLVAQILGIQPQAIILQQQMKLVELKISMLLLFDVASGCASATAPGKQDVEKNIAKFLGKAYKTAVSNPDKIDKLDQYAKELYDLISQYNAIGFDSFYNQYVDHSPVTKEKALAAEECISSVSFAALCESTIELARSICYIPQVFFGNEYCQPVSVKMPKAAELVKSTCFL